MSSFENVTVAKKANVYFDGKCVSHTITFPDGIRKSVGVILPNSGLRFDLTSKEVMEITEGIAYVSVNGAPEIKYSSGEKWFDNYIFKENSQNLLFINTGRSKLVAILLLELMIR